MSFGTKDGSSDPQQPREMHTAILGTANLLFCRCGDKYYKFQDKPTQRGSEPLLHDSTQVSISEIYLSLASFNQFYNIKQFHCNFPQKSKLF